jgi:putative flippase GtrA
MGHDAHAAPTLDRAAFDATVHCLTGCAIGEVLGLVIATWLGWHDLPSVVLAIVLAFVFGYALTIRTLLNSGMTFRAAYPIALGSDTLSITTMEIVDTAIVLLIPGVMAAGLLDPLFWGSLAVALLIAAVVAFPVNRWLISRGRGHALMHEHH